MSDKKNYLNELKKAAVALGLMASGTAALTGCNTNNKVDQTTEITTEYDTSEEKKEEINQDAIDLIIEMYNAPLSEENKITRDELGIITISDTTPFITEIDGKYHYDYTKYSNDTLSDGEVFSVDSKNIGGGYALVDNSKNQIIYGITKIENEIVSIDVDRISTLDGTEYTKGNYISDKYLEPNESLMEVFRNYYNERVNANNQNYKTVK